MLDSNFNELCVTLNEGLPRLSDSSSAVRRDLNRCIIYSRPLCGDYSKEHREKF